MKTALIVISIVLLASLNPTMAQGDSYDIFTFTPQPGWQRTQNADNLQFILQRGNVWCSIGLYSSTNTTGDVNQDFQADWNDLTRSYTLNTDVAREQNEVNGWQMILGTATGSGSGQQINISLITFSGSVRRGTILLLNNDFTNQLESEIAAFMGSVSVINASEAQPISNNQYQAPMGTSTNQPPMMSSGGSGSFPTPEEQTVTRSASADGWLVEATNDYIQYSNPDIKVIQYFYVAPEDPNSNTDDEDLFWRKFLSNYFATDQYNKFPNEPYVFEGRVESASGYATYQPTSRRYYLTWIVGLKCSFLAITSHESVYQKYFSHPNDIVALERYNYFPVTAEDLQGKWEDSGFSGAMLYNSYAGNAVGMTYAAVSKEWTFAGNSTRYFSNGGTGSGAAMNTFTVEEFGAFQLSGNDLTVQVTKPIPKTHEFWCGIVAGKGGLLLKLANKKFTNQIDFFSRKQ